MPKVSIGIEDDARKKSVAILNTVLASDSVLYTKTRNYHWNVTGPTWRDLHKLLEEQYLALAESNDEIAERARSLGGNAVGTMTEFLQCSKIQDEKPNHYPSAHTMVRSLVDDHETIIRYLRESISATDDWDDVGTSDMLTTLMEAHEKMAWMLRAFLEGEGV
jgi:DNA-binding ferritin-like protein (oxidative damage protectant)